MVLDCWSILAYKSPLNHFHILFKTRNNYLLDQRMVQNWYTHTHTETNKQYNLIRKECENPNKLNREMSIGDLGKQCIIPHRKGRGE
jgi:hypothetical protein